MYLTRLFLNSGSLTVQADVRDPARLHRIVMLAFPDNAGESPRLAHHILHRIDREQGGRLVLLVQSSTKPLTERWPTTHVLDVGSDTDMAFSAVGENPAVRSIATKQASISSGDSFRFRLCANTTRKIDTKTAIDGKKRNGRRVPVRGDEARLAWLARRAVEAGFTFDQDTVRITEVASAGGRGNSPVTLAGAVFEGLLVVQDAHQFRVALQTGIGPGKAYGFGLLSIRRAP